MTRSRALLTRPLLFLALLAATVLPAAAQPAPDLEARVAAALSEAHGDAVPAGLARSMTETLSQETKLNASDGAGSDAFAWSVALSGDRALIGARDHACADGSLRCGAAYMFAFDSTTGTWSEEQKLTASAPDAETFDQFGYSVALEGDHALIGADDDDCASGGDQACGAVYFFEFDGTQWVERQKLAASDEDGFAVFGSSLALSGDRVLIGAPGSSPSGAAYFFRYDGTSWVEEAKVNTPTVSVLAQFGFSVALDGDHAFVAAPFDDNCGGAINITRCGSAYFFSFDGSQPPGQQWVEEQKINASDFAELAGFGFSVALSSERALFGAPGFSAAYYFGFDGSQPLGQQWVEEQKVIPSDGGVGAEFGWSVALEGERALIGATGAENSTSGEGAAYVFALDAGTGLWSEEQRLIAGDGLDSSVGYSVALSGERALVGAADGLCADNLSACGTAYIFGPTPPLDLSARNTTPRIVLPTIGVSFAYTVDNNTAAPASGQLWFNARTSGGATVAQAVILAGTLPAGFSQNGTYTQAVPGNAPAGQYTYCLRLGVFPNTVVDESCFILTVQGTARPSGPAAWSVQDVTPWTNARTENAPEVSSTSGLPASVALDAAYPNPFAEQTTLGFVVPEAGHVTLTVYDVLGRTVAVLLDGEVEAGRHTAVLDGRTLPSGSYLVRLETAGTVQTQRLTLLH